MEKISKLEELLKNMTPELAGGKYYFASVDEMQLMALSSYLDCIICVYREKEGLTIVFSEEITEEMKEFTEKEIIGPFALIALNIYSDLMAVGLLAKITDTLAKERISVNAFSAYHHDHVFVPYERKDEAMRELKKLQGGG